MYEYGEKLEGLCYGATYVKCWDLTETDIEEEIEREKRKADSHRRIIENAIARSVEEYIHPIKESEKKMGEKEEWTLYEVIIIDKEEPELLTDKAGEYYVAKTPEMALAKAGYYSYLKAKDHDTTKLVKKVSAITDIRPVEDNG